MGNTLQPNPSDATADFVQPDWNTAHGDGVEPAGDDKVDLQENYQAQRENAQERVDETEPTKMAGDNTDDSGNDSGNEGEQS